MLIQSLRPALYLQILHLFFCIVWNLAGLLLIAQGGSALGPTASLGTAVLLFALGVLLVLGARRSPWLYISISLVAALGAASAILPAFYQDPALWLSDAWRFAGVFLNSLGLIGACWGTSIWWKYRAVAL